MEFIILAEHLNFLGELLLLVHSLHVLLIVIEIIVILKLNIDRRYGLLKYFVDLSGKVKILGGRVLAVQRV